MIQPRIFRSADGIAIPTDTSPPSPVFWLLQPCLLFFVYFAAVGSHPFLNAYGALAVGFALLTLAERAWPARREWTQSMTEWLQVLAMFAISAVGLIVVELMTGLASAHAFDGLHRVIEQMWPTTWPLIADVLIAFVLMQFVAYWSHRLQHEVGFLWRLFGHGTHHTYEKLSAINWNTTHPFEAALLAVPASVLALAFNQGEAAFVASALIMMQTAIVHTNLRLNERGVGLVLTTNSQHMQHHSSEFAESQTNYGCAMTLWDRVFGTFSANPTTALGDPMDGERTIWKRLTLPMRGGPQ